MNPKIKSKKMKRRSEFRFHSTSIISKSGKQKLKDHPSYIFLQNGDIYIYVQLTHSKTIRGKILIKLKKNPNPADLRDSYFIKEILEDKIEMFKGKKKEWKISKSDETRIRNLYKNSTNA